MTRGRLAAIWVALQVCCFLGWAWSEERRLAPAVGRSVLVRVEPVDPRDLLRGQYLQLGYAFGRPDRVWNVADDGADVWVVLRPEGEFHVFDHAERARPLRLPPDQVAIRGRHERWRVQFGIESFFVPEGTETPDPRDLTVRLRIGADGAARIEQVYRLGQPWP